MCSSVKIQVIRTIVSHEGTQKLVCLWGRKYDVIKFFVCCCFLFFRRMSIFREVSSIVIGICFCVWSLKGINVMFILSLVVVLCACVSLGIEFRLNGLSVEQLLYENYERGKERERAMSDSGTVDALKIEVSANQNNKGMVFVPSETVTPVTPGSPASGVDEMETVDETGEEMFATVLTVGNQDEDEEKN